MRYSISRFFNSKSILILAVIAVIGISLSIYSKARADVAPPQSPPGANPEIDQVTEVRMMDEKVVIEIQPEEDVDELGTARVWAEFHMKNLGSTTERLMVRFPISFSDGFRGYPEIEDLMVYVDNVSVPTSKITLEGEPEDWDDPVKWTEFEVIFPPGEIVEIEVDYTLYGTGYYPYVTYGYLLETGAGWNGTIGSAEIIVRLPYRASTSNVLTDGRSGFGQTTAGSTFSDNEIIWTLNDFEPEREHNIHVVLVWPSVWQRILDEQKYVYDFPEDGEAWGMLAKHYKEVSRYSRGFRVDDGGEFLHQQSVKAYEKALEFLPNDALWHAGYADLLIHRGWWQWPLTAESREYMLDGLSQLYLAYQIDPDHEFIQDLLKSSNNHMWDSQPVEEVNGVYDFTWLTATPPLPTEDTEWATIEAGKATGQAEETKQAQAPRSTPSPMVIYTATPEPMPTEENVTDEEIDEGVEDQGKKGLPICGSAILAPIALGSLVVLPAWSRNRKSGKKEK